MSLNERSTAAALGGHPAQKPFRHGDWLEIRAPHNDLRCAQLYCESPRSPVHMSDYLAAGGQLLENEYIVVHQWLNAFGVSMVSPGSKDFYLNGSFLLEDLGQATSIEDKVAKLRKWKTLAVLAGVVLGTKNGGRPNEAQIEEAKGDAALVESAIASRGHWPFPFRYAAGMTADILLNHAGLEIDANGLVHPKSPSGQMSSVDWMKQMTSCPIDQEKQTQFELLDLPQNAATDMPTTPSSAQATALTPIHVLSTQQVVETGLGDRLDPPFHSAMRSGLFPPNFTSQGHHLRHLASFAILMHVPDEIQSSTGMDCLICTISDANRYARDNSCVLYLGKKDETMALATPTVRMWKAAAACFGVYAVANSSLIPEPLSHWRTQELIVKNEEAVFQAIELWPIAAHAHLKPLARARAQAVLDGKVAILTPNKNPNHRTPKKLSVPVPSMNASATMTPQTQEPVLITTLPGTATPEVAQPIPQQRQPRQARTTARPPVDTIEAIMERARTSNLAAVQALTAEVEAADLKINTKRQMIEKMMLEVSEESAKVAQQRAQLNKFKLMFDDTVTETAAAAV